MGKIREQEGENRVNVCKGTACLAERQEMGNEYLRGFPHESCFRTGDRAAYNRSFFLQNMG